MNVKYLNQVIHIFGPRLSQLDKSGQSGSGLIHIRALENIHILL